MARGEQLAHGGGAAGPIVGNDAAGAAALGAAVEEDRVLPGSPAGGTITWCHMQA